MTGRHRPQGVPLRPPRCRRRPRLSPEAPQLVLPQAHKQRRWPVWSAEAWGPRARYRCHQPGCCPSRIPRPCPPARVPPRLRRPCQRRSRRPRAARPLLVRARPARPPPVLLPSSALPVTSGYPRRPGSWPRRPPRTPLGPPRAVRSGLPGRSRPSDRRRSRPRPRPAVRRPPSLPGQHHLRWSRPPLLGRNPPRRWLGLVRPARRPPGVPRHVPIPVPPPPPARPRGRARRPALKTGEPCHP
jgi:hypothetical protein